MNLTDNNARFIVYRHISPSGKQYVGITSKSVSERWGSGGSGYKNNAHLWSAIQKYGWDAFTHEIVAVDLSLADASSLESELIEKFNLMDPECGYNHTSGGNWSTPSDEVRDKLRERTQSRWADPVYRAKVISQLQGHTVTAATRVKISNANKGRLLDHPSPLKGRQLTEAHKAKLRGREAWNKGQTKFTHVGILQGSMKLQGRVRSDEHCQHISESRKAQYASGYSPVWINDGTIETTIDSVDLVPAGFSLGRLSTTNKYIHKDGVIRRIPVDQLDEYLSSGWAIGRGSTLQQKQATQKYRWRIDDQVFDTAEDLATYLRNNGYPKIVPSTITSLYIKGFSHSRAYHSLSGRIIREDI